VTDYFPAPARTGEPGVGIIGVDFQIGGLPFAWQDTILSQYANSPRMLGLVSSFAAAVDQGDELDDFYDMLWNVQTATGYGLDVWGRIVGVSRVVPVVISKYVGFEEGGTTDYDTFGPGGSSPFYSGQPLTSGFSLDDTPYRQLIFAKAAVNIYDGSIGAINNILSLMFPGQVAYVIDNQDMTMTYRFLWDLTPVEASIAISSGVLPRPCGVSVDYVQGP
jgi:hypothetical protein